MLDNDYVLTLRASHQFRIPRNTTSWRHAHCQPSGLDGAAFISSLCLVARPETWMPKTLFDPWLKKSVWGVVLAKLTSLSRSGHFSFLPARQKPCRQTKSIEVKNKLIAATSDQIPMIKEKIGAPSSIKKKVWTVNYHITGLFWDLWQLSPTSMAAPYINPQCYNHQ